MIFLEDSDIFNFAASCKNLHKIIYSPIGYKILFYSRCNLNFILKSTPSYKKKNDDMDLTSFDFSSIENRNVQYGEGEDL